METTLQKRCHACKRLMRVVRENYHYTECGLNAIFLKDILVFHCECGIVVPEIPQMAALHRLIVFNLVKKTTLLAGEEIRFLRKMAGISSVDLAKFMGVHPVTISKWENNTNNIGSSNDRVLRLICFSGILQNFLKLRDDKLVGQVASRAKEVSSFDVKGLLERIEQRNDGPKTVTIDPSVLNGFECAEEDLAFAGKATCN